MKKILIIVILAVLALGTSQFLLKHNRKVLDDLVRVTVEIWNVPPKSLPLQRQLWDETVKRFEALHPGVHIKGVEREYTPEEFITVMAGG
jgi:ABC-type glycerol-3-phosphate transport system substrate-binding protein